MRPSWRSIAIDDDLIVTTLLERPNSLDVGNLTVCCEHDRARTRTRRSPGGSARLHTHERAVLQPLRVDRAGGARIPALPGSCSFTITKGNAGSILAWNGPSSCGPASWRWCPWGRPSSSGCMRTRPAPPSGTFRMCRSASGTIFTDRWRRRAHRADLWRGAVRPCSRGPSHAGPSPYPAHRIGRLGPG